MFCGSMGLRKEGKLLNQNLSITFKRKIIHTHTLSLQNEICLTNCYESKANIFIRYYFFVKGKVNK